MAHREPDAPPVLFETLSEQRDRLVNSRRRFGDYILPEILLTEDRTQA